MIFKYFKNNKCYFILFTVINTLLLTLGGCLISKLDINNFKSYKHIIKNGDIFLLDSQNHEKEYYESVFNSTIIDVGLCEDLKNPYINNNMLSNSLVISYVPIFFVEDKNYGNECIMDYDTFIFNNSPTFITIMSNDYGHNKIKIKVNNNVFSEKPGVYFLKNDNILENIFYYAIEANDKNINNLCNYYDEFDLSNNLICYYGDLIDFYSEKSKIKKIQVKISYIVTCYVLVMTLICLFIYLFYIKKNFKDYNLLYQVGESKYKISIFINSIILCSFILSILLSFASINIFIFVYNSYLSNLLLKFGKYTTIIFIFFILCQIVNIIIVNIISLKRIKKE